ncbi:microfibril-associated glycoprotein 4-like [Anguilla rostrata]|uniref:microfibril-associated glycoprotein 4-like n=1 Tax=Anguilla rostrata TaxID=7938 RepID=UPI0030D2D33D
MMVSVFLLLLLSVGSFSLPAAQAQLPEDCHDVYKNGSTHSGVYTIYPPEYNKAVQVYCDMDCEDKEDKGGWTVFQRRLDGSLNFYRPWDQYKSGFGDISGEHWLGLDNIFAISWQKKYRLRVDMEDFEGGNVHAEYSSFSLDPESDGYRLNIDNYIDEGVGDYLRYSNRMQFSTFDHGSYSYTAENYHGGFWYTYRVYANPNGLYKWGRHSDYRRGILWDGWKGTYYSLKAISMKIRPLSLEHVKN